MQLLKEGEHVDYELLKEDEADLTSDIALKRGIESRKN